MQGLAAAADDLTLLAALGGGIVLLVALSAVILLREARRRDAEQRIMQAVWGDPATGTPQRAALMGWLYSLGERVRRGSRLYSAEDIEHLRGVIQAAGGDPRRVVPVLLGVKLVAMVALPMVAALLSGLFVESLYLRLAAIGAGLVLGILGPEWALALLRRPYMEALRRGTPDALDLLVVCSEAGMGLESGLERVAHEMGRSNPPMAMVLHGLLDDLRLLPDRREAFANFGRRSGIEGLQRLATMLGQSLQYGTPLSQALRAVSGELRRERMANLEERAVKLPALLIFPMIFFIMPSLYIVLLGVSFMRLYDALAGFTSTLPGAH